MNGKDASDCKRNERSQNIRQSCEMRLADWKADHRSFPDKEIWQACLPNLTWTHICCLLRVSDETARLWYMKEAVNENWSYRTLDRNISTQYYYRLLQSPKKEQVEQKDGDKFGQLALLKTRLFLIFSDSRYKHDQAPLSPYSRTGSFV